MADGDHYILLAEPQREAVAVRRLIQLGFRPYAPQIRERGYRTVRSMFGSHRRECWRVRPLFPGYLFLPVDIFGPKFGLLHAVAGLRKGSPCLINGQGRVLLSGEAVDMVRHIEASVNDPQSRGLPYRVGDRVRVIEGAFRDMVGKISRLDDAQRIELLMGMLGGQARIRVAARQIAVET